MGRSKNSFSQSIFITVISVQNYEIRFDKKAMIFSIQSNPNTSQSNGLNKN